MIIPDGYAQVNLIFTGSGVPTGAEMTFGVDLNNPALSPADVGNLVTANYDGADLEGMKTNQLALSGVLVKFGPTETGPSSLVGASITGNAAGTAVPPNTSVLIHKNTAFGGRAGRGRMFYPGIPEAQVDQSGIIVGTWLAFLNTRWNAFRTGMEGDDLPLVLLHGASSPISTPSPIFSLEASATVATQRRRLRR